MPETQKAQSEPQGISAREAFAIAMEAFNQFYPELGSQPESNVSLEEIEEEQDDNHWLITLGFDVKRRVSGFEAMVHGLTVPKDRVYKTFKIDKKTGKVVSMKIRSLT
jgi:hypothetical protein